ncbi:unnamed protein product [Rotaria magnacalcarata]|uniref:G domain-containing protein n=1 Tax=Rotaria magnacalcarata TaxID=392030 RepID=A0A816UVC5_9BILA|nr:unnamed protein product [Rotaria magnacalcarata]
MLTNQFTRISDYASSTGIKRKAISGFGRVGSLYDCCRDNILANDNRRISSQSYKMSGSVKCMVIHGHSEAGRNLLRTIDIENDLRLSLLLNLTRTIGIASVLTHPNPISENTRFLSYSWIARQEQISNDAIRNMKLADSIAPTRPATHLITGVDYGIDVLAVLQLPSETRSIMEIDHILQKISRCLPNGANIRSLLTAEENDRLRKINNITIYSNIPDLTALDDIFKLFHQIQIIKQNSNACQPITYLLQPLAELHPKNMRNYAVLHDLPPELHHSLEQYVLRRRTTIQSLKEVFQKKLERFLKNYLEGLLHGAHVRYLQIKRDYHLEMKQLSNLLFDFRSGQIGISVVNNSLIDKNRTNSTYEFVRTVYDLEEKAIFISYLLNHNFSYFNAIDHNINNRDNENTIPTKIPKIGPHYRILCSDDTLNRNYRENFNQIRLRLQQEQQRDPSLRLIYADFSYSLYKVHNIHVLGSTNNENRPIQQPQSSFKKSSTFPEVHREERPPLKETPNATRSSLTDETINILLLGETGVGKSTFINAFINYLRFGTLEKAQSNTPSVLIPVSFTMTIGDHFEERTVKFGNVKDSNDEDFNHPGQSVTQHCKSYIFTLNHNEIPKNVKIRIIDTPGFGDTRGVGYDDRNMKHILQYINNLTHLNAICFLLKPNASRLNIFFRTYLTQLFSFIGPTVRDKILFCFTNARSTFYTPGNTAPLLKSMLAESSMGDISFTKKNTFSFDSESFRYLVALQNRIPFTLDEKREYELSWSTSAKEATRLIDYIRANHTSSPIRSGFQSMKQAQFEISSMIRPILETIRNILRNIILCKMNQSNISIELYPKHVLNPTAMCFTCHPPTINLSQFWITLDVPHQFKTKCNTCSCAAGRHAPIDYVLEYKSVGRSPTYHLNEMNEMLHRIYFASAELSLFLIHVACSTNDDLFILGFKQMIMNEEKMCAEQQSNKMNMQLVTELEKAQYEYEQRVRDVVSDRRTKTLANIYEKMREIRNYPQINEQMLAIERGQQAIMKQNEIVV